MTQLSNGQNHTFTSQPSAIPLLKKLEQNGYSTYTIDATAKHLKRLGEHCNLNEPQQVLDYVSGLKVSNGYKINLYKAYRHLANFYGIPFTMPKKLRAESQAVTIPTLEKLNAFIAYARRGLALKLRISKETGLRPIEVVTLKAKDIDPDHKTITPTTAKKGLPRTLPMSQPLAETLRAEIQKRRLQPNDYLFTPIAKYYCKTFIAMRTRLAKQMNDPTIKQIKLYHFRHYFGTMIQLKYRDVPTTAHLLGHRDWKNTQIYVDLAKILEMGEDGENYIVKTATNVKEDAELIQLGFTYVTERDNVKIYRKRK